MKNPKAEIRSPKEIRNPKAEGGSAVENLLGSESAFWMWREDATEETMALHDGEANEEPPRPDLMGDRRVLGHSGFGIRISFGFRSSDFGFSP